MKVQIRESLYLESDETQFYLKDYTGSFDKKTGAPLYKTIGYYSKPEQAFQKILNIMVASSDAETLEQLVKDIKQTREYIKTTLSVNPEGA